MEKVKIDFASSKNQLLLNPRYHDEEKASFLKLSESFPHIKNHFWIATSGSSGAPKLVALSSNAILLSAKVVNNHLQSQSDDIWLLALPTFHVGGLGVLARAQLTNSKVATLSAWSPLDFIELCNESKATLSALVPTQLFDLLSLDIPAPSSLRACVVGGGSLSERLYTKARSLNWPILPSYGMTECASQIATARLDSLQQDPSVFPALYTLPHVKPYVDNTLVIESDSLLTGYAEFSNAKPIFLDPKRSGRFTTSDIVELIKQPDGIIVKPKGRITETVKISGELVSLSKLDDILSELSREIVGVKDAAVITLPDDRKQNAVHIVGVGDADSLRTLARRFNETVLPFERAHGLHRADSLPRTTLGKVMRASLVKMATETKNLSL